MLNLNNSFVFFLLHVTVLYVLPLALHVRQYHRIQAGLLSRTPLFHEFHIRSVPVSNALCPLSMATLFM
jgi:hypothetical protein